MPRERAPDGPYLTPQITLRGRNAWVVEQLAMARTGSVQGVPEAAAWIIDQWISGEGRSHLLEVYELDPRTWNRRRNAVQIAKTRRHGGHGGAR